MECFRLALQFVEKQSHEIPSFRAAILSNRFDSRERVCPFSLPVIIVGSSSPRILGVGGTVRMLPTA